MPNDKNKLQTIVEFVVDKLSLNKSKRAYDELEDKAKNSDKQLQKQKRGVDDLGDAYSTFGKKASDAIGKIGTEYKGLAKLDDDLRTRLKQRDEDFGSLSNRVGLAGDFQSNLGAIQGLSSQAGFTGLSEGVGSVGEIGVLLEELPRLKQAIAGLPDVARVASSELGLSVAQLGAAGLAVGVFVAGLKILEQTNAEVRQGVENLVNAQRTYYQEIEGRDLEGTTNRLAQAQSDLRAESALLADITDKINNRFAETQNNGGLLGDAFARINVAIGSTDPVLQEYINQQAEAENKVSELTAEVVNLTKARDDLTNATETAAEAEARRAEQSRLRANEFISYADEVRGLREFEEQTLNSNTEANERLLQSLQKDIDYANEQIKIVESSGEANEETAAAIKRYNDEIDLAKQKIDILTTSSIPYTQQLDKEAQLKKEAEESSKNQVKAEEGRLKKLEDNAKAFDRALAKQAQFAQQAGDLIDRFNERESDFNRKRGDDLQDFQIKVQQDTQDHNRKLLDISRQGNQRIESLNQSLDDLQNDYFQSQIDNQRAYANELENIDERRNLDRIQREREGAQTLDELAYENNVIAFLREKRKQDQERTTTAENQSLEDQQRARQFNLERQQQEQAFLQRRALIQRQITEEQAAIRQRIAAENEAFQISQQRNQQAFDLAQERAQRELELERQKTVEQLRLIQAKAQAEVNAVSGTTAQVRILQNAVNGLSASVANFARSASNVGSSSSRSVFGLTADVLAQREAARKAAQTLRVSTNGAVALSDYNRLGVAFASGGIARRPTLGLVGERPGFEEAIIPFRPSEGIRPALQRAGVNTMPSVYLTINAQVGENASVSQVKQMITQAVDESETKIIRGVAGGITKARYNNASA